MGKKKFGMGKHTSIPKGLETSIKDLSSQEGVSRTILGVFSPCGNKFRKGYLKVQTETSTGIKVNGYTPSGVLEIFVSIDPLDKREEIIDYIHTTYRR